MKRISKASAALVAFLLFCTQVQILAQSGGMLMSGAGGGSPAASSSPAISSDTFTTHSSTSAIQTHTVSHTIGATSNRYSIVAIVVDGTQTVNTVTHAGSSTGVSFIDSQENSDNFGRIEFWQIVAPATGTNNLVVTLSNSANVVIGIATFSNVDQTTPRGTAGKNAGGSGTGPATVSVTAGADDITFSAIGVSLGTSTTATPSAGTERWDLMGVGNTCCVMNAAATIPGALSSHSFTFSASAAGWTIIAVPIKKAP